MIKKSLLFALMIVPLIAGCSGESEEKRDQNGSDRVADELPTIPRQLEWDSESKRVMSPFLAVDKSKAIYIGTIKKVTSRTNKDQVEEGTFELHISEVLKGDDTDISINIKYQYLDRSKLDRNQLIQYLISPPDPRFESRPIENANMCVVIDKYFEKPTALYIYDMDSEGNDAVEIIKKIIAVRAMPEKDRNQELLELLENDSSDLRSFAITDLCLAFRKDKLLLARTFDIVEKRASDTGMPLDARENSIFMLFRIYQECPSKTEGMGVKVLSSLMGYLNCPDKEIRGNIQNGLYNCIFGVGKEDEIVDRLPVLKIRNLKESIRLLENDLSGETNHQIRNEIKRLLEVLQEKGDPEQPEIASEQDHHSRSRPAKCIGEDRVGSEIIGETNEGFLFVDGKYIEPPYKIERRGVVWLINNMELYKDIYWPYIKPQKTEAERKKPKEENWPFGKPKTIGDGPHQEQIFYYMIARHGDAYWDYIVFDKKERVSEKEKKDRESALRKEAVRNILTDSIKFYSQYANVKSVSEKRASEVIEIILKNGKRDIFEVGKRFDEWAGRAKGAWYIYKEGPFECYASENPTRRELLSGDAVFYDTMTKKPASDKPSLFENIDHWPDKLVVSKDKLRTDLPKILKVLETDKSIKAKKQMLAEISEWYEKWMPEIYLKKFTVSPSLVKRMKLLEN